MSSSSSIFKVIKSLPVAVAIGTGVLASAATSRAQSYNLFFTPQSTGNEVWAYCVDVSRNPGGQFVYWCPLEIYTDVYHYTNAHIHDDPSHPRSSFACADPLQCSPSGGKYVSANTTWKGSVEVWIATTLVGQAELICASASGGTDCLDFVVGYNDIYYNDHPEIWEQVGGNTTGHGDNRYNHWMKSNPAYALYYCTVAFLQQHPEQGKICTNDMSLPFGGVFDLNRNWTSPHTYHRKGDSVDIPTSTANQCPSYRVPDAIRRQFLELCINNYGALSELPNCTGSCLESNHIHFRWNVP